MKLSSLFLMLLFASTILAQEPDSTSALYRMREAERNFARESVMIGRNAAFVKNFAEESVIYTDKWLKNGRQFWKNRKDVPVVLKWEPEFMDIAESRDFGISTGPWEVQEYRPNTPVQSTGYFLTVWEMENGVWKVRLDVGSATPAVLKATHAISYPPGADRHIVNPPVISIEKSIKGMLDQEKKYLMEWKKNHDLSVYLSFLEPSAMMQRDGHLPTIITDTIRVWVDQRDKNLNWNSTGAGAASSGDMGYTYGLMELPGNPTTVKGHYVRIWKRQPGGIWKISLEMMSLD